MHVDSQIALVTVLVIATLLGIVMGYCLGLLRHKQRARQAIEQASKALEQSRAAVEVDLASARTVVNDQREAMASEREQVQKALKRESALEVHSQLQAQRIQTLESQVRAFEDQHVRLKRDFAKYKADKRRELELARNRQDAASHGDELPVLQRRIVDSGTRRGTRSVDAQRSGADRPGFDSDASVRYSRGLSSPLSRELEIPALAESELPDSVEDLDFELVDLDGTGELPRG